MIDLISKQKMKNNLEIQKHSVLRAELSDYLRIHSLRHTYALLMLRLLQA